MSTSLSYFYCPGSDELSSLSQLKVETQKRRQYTTEVVSEVRSV